MLNNLDYKSMRKINLMLVMSLLTMSVAFGQKNATEVLYFKAQLACCKARACTALQTDVDSVLIKYFSKEKIALRVVALADEANKALIDKYNAQSQTVILVRTIKKKEFATDLTPIVQAYKQSNDKAKFEQEMKAKIEEVIK